MNQGPLSQVEYEKLLQILSLISTNIDRLLTQGMVDESLDDERIESSKRKVDSYRDQIRREQTRVRKLRDYLRRRKDQDRKRKSTSDH